MKTYIIFTPEITSMGGAQLYTANKVKFLESKGWNVFVFFFMKKNDIKIPELKRYENNRIVELGMHQLHLSKKDKLDVINRISSNIPKSDEIVLESQILSQCYFAEEIAQALGARHIINNLEERIPKTFPNQNKFLEYKLKRWEFQNASERRLHNVFGKDFKDDFLQYQNNMTYCCSNVIQNEDRDFGFSRADYTILSIGRLEKPYISPMTNEIVSFARTHIDKIFNVIYIGGSYSGLEEAKIKSMYNNSPNVNLYMLGYMFPVPKSIIDATDVAIATANSVLVTAENDIPTIVTDIHDDMAIGVYGYNTKNRFSRESEPVLPVGQYLEEILISHKFPKKGHSLDPSQKMNESFEKELLFIEKSKNNKGYFNIASLTSFSIWLKEKLIWYKWMILDPKRIDPRIITSN